MTVVVALPGQDVRGILQDGKQVSRQANEQLGGGCKFRKALVGRRIDEG